MTRAVLEGVRDLLPSLRERADEAERLRVVPDANVKELEETGFFQLLQPAWFDGLELHHEDDGTTCFRGPVADQAALHGVLERMRGIGLPLVSVVPVDPDGDAPPPSPSTTN